MGEALEPLQLLPAGVMVRRSFAEPDAPSPRNKARDDRSFLWGVVEVAPAGTW